MSAGGFSCGESIGIRKAFLRLLLGVDCDQAVCQPVMRWLMLRGSFAGVQFSETRAAASSFFDARTGEVIGYDDGMLNGRYRLTKLGTPLVKENNKKPGNPSWAARLFV